MHAGCRVGVESRQCVGKVEYLVKATPRTCSLDATAAAARYGVPLNAPQRFAMCKLWPVQGCGYVPSQFTPGGRVAVPLDACLQETAWKVQLVVKIKPGATASENQAAAAQQNTDPEFRKAANKWASCDQFWVHAFGLSKRH